MRAQPFFAILHGTTKTPPGRVGTRAPAADRTPCSSRSRLIQSILSYPPTLQIEHPSDPSKRFGVRARDTVNYTVLPQTFVLPLSQGKVAVVDRLGFLKAGHLKWSALRMRKKYGELWYAINGKGGRIVSLHRLLMDAPPRTHVDHRNSDGLDCRFENMRIATPAQNQANQLRRPSKQSQYKGVLRFKHSFGCVLMVRRQRIARGGFDSEEAAARAYDGLAREYFGEFAGCNFPESEAVS